MRKHAIEVNSLVEKQMQEPEHRHQKVLIVEDDEDTRRVYAIMLRHAGFLVVEAADGRQAIACATDDRPDLILMDMNLPMLDGWEAARSIKAVAHCASVPLVAFSALIDSIADLRRDVALFDGFIAKPVSPSELVRRVSAYLDLLGPMSAGPARQEPSATAAA